MRNKKILLSEKELPTHYYNVVADMPNKPLPPLHPGTREPIGPEMLEHLFHKELIKQEVTTDRYVEIPEQVRDIYLKWKPTPIYLAHDQIETFEAGLLFAQTEGIIRAPETNHAIATAIQEAKRCKKEGKEETILIHLCGHGYFDLKSYDNYMAGKLKHHEVTDEEIKASLAQFDVLQPV